MFLIICTLLVFFYFFYSGIELNTLSIVSVQQIRKTQKRLYKQKRDPEDFPFIVLLIPVLSEQKIIRETLLHFSKLRYPKNRVKVIFITTQKEPLGKITTHEILEETIPDINKAIGKKIFEVVHYPLSFGGRAHQLNYAVSKLNSLVDEKIVESSTYIGVYDVDSLPDERSLEILAMSAVDHFKKHGVFPSIYQQPALYLGNIASLSRNLSGILLKTEGFIQTRWSLGYEIPRWNREYSMLMNRTNPSSMKNLFLRQLTYAVGHGEYFRLDVLRQLKLFPVYLPVTDDLAIGHIASFLSIPKLVIPCFDVTKVPRSVYANIKQAGTWFGGSTYLSRNFLEARKISGNSLSNLQSFKLLIDGYLTMLAWMSRPFLWGIAFFFAVVWIKDPFILLFSIVAFILYAIAGTLTVFLLQSRIRSLYRGADVLDYEPGVVEFLLLLVLGSTGNFFIRSFGPVRYTFLRVWHILLRRNLEKVYTKTER